MTFELDGELNQNPGCMVIRDSIEIYLSGMLDDDVADLVKNHICCCSECHDYFFERAFADFRGPVYVGI